MKKLTPDEQQEFYETIQKAKEVSAKYDEKLMDIAIASRSTKVIEAVNKVFGLKPDENGKIIITYSMYSEVISKMRTAGSYKSEEFK